MGASCSLSVTENSYSVSGNTSSVYVKLKCTTTGASYNLLNPSGKVVINGTTYNFNHDIPKGSTTTIFSKTVTIPHNADGTKSLTVSYKFYTNISADTLSGSKTVTLTKIPRATTPTLSASSVTMGNALTIKCTPASSSFSHKLYYSWESSGEVQIASLAAGTQSYAWTVPVSFASSIPAAVSGTCRIVCRTYDAGTLIGSATSVSFTASVPESCKPTITSVAISEGDASVAAAYDCYVQGKSKLHIVTAATTSYGSPIVSVKHQINGVYYTSSNMDYTSGVINVSGTVRVMTYVVDARGRTSSISSYGVNVVPYHVPQITRFETIRCNDDGTENPDGQRVKISMCFAVSPINDKNAKSYKIEYKLSSADTYIAIPGCTGSVYAFDGELITDDLFAVSSTYQIRLTVADTFTSSEVVNDVEMSMRLINYIVARMMIAFGKFAELDNTMDIDLQVLIRQMMRIMIDDKEIMKVDGTGASLIASGLIPAMTCPANGGSITLPADGIYLLMITHASTANGNGLMYYYTSTSAIGTLKSAPDVSITKSGRKLSFTCSYGPVVRIVKIG